MIISNKNNKSHLLPLQQSKDISKFSLFPALLRWGNVRLVVETWQDTPLKGTTWLFSNQKEPRLEPASTITLKSRTLPSTADENRFFYRLVPMLSVWSIPQASFKTASEWQGTFMISFTKQSLYTVKIMCKFTVGHSKHTVMVMITVKSNNFSLSQKRQCFLPYIYTSVKLCFSHSNLGFFPK